SLRFADSPHCDVDAVSLHDALPIWTVKSSYEPFKYGKEKVIRVQSRPFELVSKFKPQGDQQQAIDKLVQGIREGEKYQTLLGATDRKSTRLNSSHATISYAVFG